MEQRVNRKEAAEMLGLSQVRIKQLVDSGRLDETKDGITVASIKFYAANRRKAGRPFGTFKK